MGYLTRRERRIILESSKTSEICKIIEDEPDQKIKGKKLIEMLRILYPNFPEKSEEIFAQFRGYKLPKNFCREIGREDNPTKVEGFAVAESADMIRDSVKLDTSKSTGPSINLALVTMYEWLQSDHAASAMLSSLRRKNGTEFMEFFVKDNYRVVCHLLQQGEGVRNVTLELLEGVAEHPSDSTVPRIISDILEDSAHSERWKAKASRILKIANIVNPVDPPTEKVFMDTAYFINWGHKCYFSNPGNSQIRDLIDDLCRLVTDSPARECALKSITCFRRSLCQLLRISRTIDLLMFLPQGVKRYRGHDIHQFNVAALGLFFLDTYVKNGLSLGDHLASVHSDQFLDPFDVKKTWILASLLHDHALPISHMFKIAPIVYDITGDESLPKNYRVGVDKMQKALKSVYGDLFSGPLYSAYHRFCIRSRDRVPCLRKLIAKEMSRIGLDRIGENGFDHFDHGLLAATNITSRFKNTPLNKIVETLTRAVAVHSLDEKTPISFKEDPLAFLLALCDELQEWGREIAVFPEILMDVSSLKAEPFNIRDGKRFFGDNLCVSFRVLENDKRTKFDPSLFDGGKKGFFEERLAFDDPDIFPKTIYVK